MTLSISSSLNFKARTFGGVVDAVEPKNKQTEGEAEI